MGTAVFARTTRRALYSAIWRVTRERLIGLQEDGMQGCHNGLSGMAVEFEQMFATLATK